MSALILICFLLSWAMLGLYLFQHMIEGLYFGILLLLGSAILFVYIYVLPKISNKKK